MTSDQIQLWLLQNNQRDGSDSGGKCVVTGPFAARDNSRLFHAKCTKLPSAAVVKLCLAPRTSQADPEAAHDQYDALLRTSKAMGADGRFSVPKPYLLDAKSGLLAVEWIPGQSMTNLVFSWRCNAVLAQELMARAGTWLRLFHAANPLPDAHLDVEEKLEFAAGLKRERALPDSVFVRGVSMLWQAAPAAAAAPLARSWLHGDFKTDNLMISDARTIGIDIHLRHENAVIYDLAPFLNFMDLRLCHPSGWRVLHLRERLHSTFLTSYFNALGMVPAVSLAWMRLYLLLGEWHTAHANAGSRLRSGMIDLCYRRVIGRVCRAMADL